MKCRGKYFIHSGVLMTFTLFWFVLLKRPVSPLTLLRTVFVFVSSFSSSLRLVLKNCFILCICCCIRQQPQDAGSVRHTEHTHKYSRLQMRRKHTDNVPWAGLIRKKKLSHRFLYWISRHFQRHFRSRRTHQPGRSLLPADTGLLWLREEEQKQKSIITLTTEKILPINHSTPCRYSSH